MRCPICHHGLDGKNMRKIDKAGNIYRYSCPSCGKYSINNELISILESNIEIGNEKRALLSHKIRKMQNQITMPNLNTELVKNILDRNDFPSPSEQAFNFILWLGENLKGPGEIEKVEAGTHRSILGAKTPKGYAWVINYLFEEGLLCGNLFKTESGQGEVTLSMKGWDKFEELKNSKNKSTKTAFMAMPFNKPELDVIFEKYFKQAVTDSGFSLYRLDETPKAGSIDDRLRVEIRKARFLIADLTHGNQGAYWEAGYAEGLGKPVIYTCEKKKLRKTHFDTNHHLTVCWSKDEPEKVVDELKSTIRATLPDAAKLSDD